MEVMTRKEALAAGLTQYYTGQPCPYGHNGMRATANGRCWQCLRDNDHKRRGKPSSDIRDEARAAGLSRYFTGKPCKNGHITERLSSNGRCIGCQEDANRRAHLVRRATPEARKKNNRRITEWRRRNGWSLEYTISHKIRRRLQRAISRNYKTGSAVRDLGCSIFEFCGQFENLFHSDMTWENWGDLWELDHIRPLHQFNLNDREQFLQAVHYTNLQPLLIADHRAKTAAEMRQFSAAV